MLFRSPPGALEKAWLQETRDLSDKNDVAARLNLGLAALSGRVAGVGKGEAVKVLASGLMLVDADTLAGADARVVKDALCNAENLAIFREDETLAQRAAQAFAHLANLNHHQAALIAGHIHACRITPPDAQKAATFYAQAGRAKDPLIREAASASLKALGAGQCYFPPAHEKTC